MKELSDSQHMLRIVLAVRIALIAITLCGSVALFLRVSHKLDDYVGTGSDEELRQTILVELAGTAATMNFDTRIVASIQARDFYRAELHYNLASLLHYPLSPATEMAYRQAFSWGAQSGRFALDAAKGFVSGSTPSTGGIIGAIIGDFLGWGDARDLARELLNYAGDRPVDDVLLGLSAFGVGVTALTYASGGTSGAARAGTTLVKTGIRSGRIVGPLVRTFGRAVDRAIDLPGMRTAVRNRDLRRLASAGSFVRPAGAKPLLRMTRDVNAIRAATSVADTLHLLKQAETASDVSRLARVSRVMRSHSAGTVELLGKRVHRVVRFSKPLALLAHMATEFAAFWAVLATAAAAAFAETLTGKSLGFALRFTRRTILRREAAGRPITTPTGFLWLAPLAAVGAAIVTDALFELLGDGGIRHIGEVDAPLASYGLWQFLAAMLCVGLCGVRLRAIRPAECILPFLVPIAAVIGAAIALFVAMSVLEGQPFIAVAMVAGGAVAGMELPFSIWGRLKLKHWPDGTVRDGLILVVCLGLAGGALYGAGTMFHYDGTSHVNGEALPDPLAFATWLGLALVCGIVALWNGLRLSRLASPLPGRSLPAPSLPHPRLIAEQGEGVGGGTPPTHQ